MHYLIFIPILFFTIKKDILIWFGSLDCFLGCDFFLPKALKVKIVVFLIFIICFFFYTLIDSVYTFYVHKDIIKQTPKPQKWLGQISFSYYICVYNYRLGLVNMKCSWVLNFFSSGLQNLFSFFGS